MQLAPKNSFKITPKYQSTYLKSFNILIAIIIFALISVFGLSFLAGNAQHSNIGISRASAQEPADLNSDNKVDVFDLSILLGKWNTADSLSDLNKDNVVNVFDLSMLLAKWGEVNAVQGCPSYPEFPSPSCTGWQHTGVVLGSCEQYVSGGEYVIGGNVNGTVVDGCDFSGKQVSIRGGGAVTLKRSRVRNQSNCDTACAAIYIENGAGPVLIEDVEVTTTDPSVTNESLRQDRTIGIAKNNTKQVILRRIYAHDTTRGLDITGQNNILIEDSYLAYNTNPPSNGDCSQERKHSSAVRAAGGVYNVSFINTVLGVGACAFSSGLVATYPEGGANHDITFDGGLWDLKSGEGYGIAAGYTIASEEQNYNFTVKNIQISTIGDPAGCSAGCAQNWSSAGTSGIGPLGGTKIWQNVTKYNPGKPDHGQPIGP